MAQPPRKKLARTPMHSDAMHECNYTLLKSVLIAAMLLIAHNLITTYEKWQRTFPVSPKYVKIRTYTIQK